MTKMSQRHHATIPSIYSELPFGEGLVLWGLRMWAQAFNQGTNIHDVIQKGFRLAGVPDACDALDCLMSIFATSGRGVIDIRCPPCSETSMDEHRIMGAFAAYQRAGHLPNGDAYLRYWLSPLVLQTARKPAYQLAKILKKGGLIIRPRPLMHDISVNFVRGEPVQTKSYLIH